MNSLSKYIVLFVILKAINFIIWPLLASYNSIDKIGVYEKELAFVTLLVPLISIQLQDSVFKFSSFRALKKVIYVATVMAGIIYLFSQFGFEKYFLEFSKIVVLGSYLQAVFFIILFYLRSINKIEYFFGLQIIQVILFFLLSFTTDLVNSYYFSYGLVTIVTSVWISKFKKRTVKDSPVSVYSLVRFSLPLLVNVLIWWVLTGYIRLVIESNFGLDVLGEYSLLTRISGLILIAQNFLVLVLGDVIIRSRIIYIGGLEIKPMKAMILSVVSVCVVSVLVYLFSDKLLKIMYPMIKYDGVVMRELILVQFFMTLSALAGPFFHKYNNTITLMITSLVSLLVLVFYNILVPFTSLLGIINLLKVAYFIQLILRIIFYAKTYISLRLA